MNASYDKTAAVVVLPPLSGGRLQDTSLRTWLARSNLSMDPEPRDLLARIVEAVGLPYPREGLGALRMWGQTGDRPTVWIAAADPVYLEPRLDHLCLHAPRRIGVPPADLRALVDHLQSVLGDEQSIGFTRLGSSGYLRADKPIASAAVPAYVIDQRVPSDFLPDGEGAASYRNLISEIEMALHDHDVNLRRVAAGKCPINSLWLWGGGKAPGREMRPQPPLYANDPLLLGYWESATAVAELWPGNIEHCVDASDGGFVAVMPEFENDSAAVKDCLQALRSALRARRFARLTLIFRDGLRADIERSHAWRFWRRESELLDFVTTEHDGS
ncbi:MAG: hypothetical protein HKO12_02795 [Woeseiaceae bacterium]|nr:hypothetical protein [Woeseiaceae bacterium]